MNLIFFETSAKNSNGVDEAFLTFATSLVEKVGLHIACSFGDCDIFCCSCTGFVFAAVYMR